jgi:hypothetical protein
VLAVDPGAMSSGLVQRGSLMLRLLIKAMPLLAWLAGFVQPNGMLRTTTKSATRLMTRGSAPGCGEIVWNGRR